MMLKTGVKLDGIAPEMVVGLLVVSSVYAVKGYACVITSCTEGQHMTGSLHYKGKAMDFRTFHIPKTDQLSLVAAVKRALGPQFDVVLEKDHLHVEFDPK